MRRIFDIGETVVCSVEVTKDGAFHNPDSAKISIYLPTGVVDINGADMTPGDTGKYHYDYDTSPAGDPLISKLAGFYRTEITAVNGTRTTILKGGFELA